MTVYYLVSSNNYIEHALDSLSNSSSNKLFKCEKKAKLYLREQQNDYLEIYGKSVSCPYFIQEIDETGYLHVSEIERYRCSICGKKKTYFALMCPTCSPVNPHTGVPHEIMDWDPESRCEDSLYPYL